MLTALSIYVFFGAIVGILAGLLGVGGGAVLVSILDITLDLQGIHSPFSHHIAIATSMANIFFTSAVSTWSHNKHGTIPWHIVRWMTPGILVGTFGSTFVVALVPATPLKFIFACFLVYAACQMLMNIKPRPSRTLPGKVGLTLAGIVIGTSSGFLGVGGAGVTIPFLVMCNVPIISVISASAALGFPIAAAGVAGYIWNGLSIPDLPPHTLGFIYLPALIGLVFASMLTTPLGAKMAHTLPVKSIKRFFGLFLVCMAIRMFYSCWG